MGIGVSLLDNRLEYSEKLLDVVYNCNTCGGCDISCKYAMDMEVLQPVMETRFNLVESGHTLPTLDRVIDTMKQNRNTLIQSEFNGRLNLR